MTTNETIFSDDADGIDVERYTGKLVTNQACLSFNISNKSIANGDDCYYFMLYDTYGNGLSHTLLTGSQDVYWMFLNNTVFEFGEWGEKFSSSYYQLRIDFCINQILKLDITPTSSPPSIPSTIPTVPTYIPTMSPTIECEFWQDDYNNGLLFESRILIDNFSIVWDETHWKLTTDQNVYGQNSSVVVLNDTSGNYNQSEIVSNEVCLELTSMGNCYTFELIDDYGDGLIDVDSNSGKNYWIFLRKTGENLNGTNNVEKWELDSGNFYKGGTNYRKSLVLQVDFCLSDFIPSPFPTLSPTQLSIELLCNQSNYTDINNYNVTIVPFTLQIQMDYWAVTWNETFWKLSMIDETLVYADNGALYNVNDTVEYQTCLDKSHVCYLFEIYDQFGDGLADAMGISSDANDYNIIMYLGTKRIFAQSWKSGSYLNVTFCMS